MRGRQEKKVGNRFKRWLQKASMDQEDEMYEKDPVEMVCKRGERRQYGKEEWWSPNMAVQCDDDDRPSLGEDQK